MSNSLKAYRVGHDSKIPEWLWDLIDSGKVLTSSNTSTITVATTYHGSQIAQRGDYIKVYPNGNLVVDRLPKVWVHTDCMCTHSKTKAGD